MAAVTVAASVALGLPKLPSLLSSPPVATKSAPALSPSMPSQLESMKPRSGLSPAPGAHAASAGLFPAQARRPVTAMASSVGVRCEIRLSMRRASRRRATRPMGARRHVLAENRQRSADGRAGCAELVERALRVAGLDVDAADRLLVDLNAQAFAQRVEGRVLHAVVRRQADHDDLVDAALAQQVGEVRAVEARVALGGGVLTLVDDDVDRVGSELGMELRPGRSG